MNEILKVLETRRSCRCFDPEKMVSDEDVAAISLQILVLKAIMKVSDTVHLAMQQHL